MALCKQCNRQFVDKQALLQHRDAVHRCRRCDKSFPTVHGRDQHQNAVHRRRFDCLRCDRSFTTEQGRDQHQNDVHPTRFKCRRCDRSFTSEQGRDQHQEDVHPTRFRCRSCNRSFASQYGLQQHRNDVHLNYCRSCNRTFGSEHALQQHRESPVHNPLQDIICHRAYTSFLDTRLFHCSPCGQYFNSNSALRIHLDTSANHRSSYICNVDDCKLSFQTTQQLDDHRSSSHPERYHCNECESYFEDKETLDTHAMTHVSQFHCCECEYDFDNEQDFNEHLSGEAHTHQKPRITYTTHALIENEDYSPSWVCEPCEKSFPNEIALSQHVVSSVHRPILGGQFHCGLCAKEFALPSALLHHLESGACGLSIFDRKELDQIFLVTSQRETRYISAVTDDDDDDDDSGSVLLTPSTCSSTPSTNAILTPAGPHSDALTPLHTPSNESAFATILLGYTPTPECFCGRLFRDSSALLRHMVSPVHTVQIHRIPEFLVPGHEEKFFKTLSGMFQHMESEVRLQRGMSENVLRRAIEYLTVKMQEVGFSGDARLLK